MNAHAPSCRPRTVCHHIICRHRVEIEVWPQSAELYFRDERYCNPANTQFRFAATVYNAPDDAVAWSVYALDGKPGLGTIDASGQYCAPDKGGLTSGYTEVVVAAAQADPLRRAEAYVTVVGLGPEPLPPPIIMLLPRKVTLYYRDGYNNGFIDESNTMQMFEALVQNSSAGITWLIDNLPAPGADNSRFYLYKVPSSGPDKAVTITAKIGGPPAASDSAKVVLVNYKWPDVILA